MYDAPEMLLVVALKYTNCHWNICQKTTYTTLIPGSPVVVSMIYLIKIEKVVRTHGINIAF